MSITPRAVESDLARYQAEVDRAEARELAREALIKEEVERLTTTIEGMDETLAYLLDRPGNDYTKTGFIEQLIKLVRNTQLLGRSDPELQIRSTLKVVAECMAEDRAGDKLRDADRQPPDWSDWPY